jgi:hypothetical protein
MNSQTAIQAINIYNSHQMSFFWLVTATHLTSFILLRVINESTEKNFLFIIYFYSISTLIHSPPSAFPALTLSEHFLLLTMWFWLSVCGFLFLIPLFLFLFLSFWKATWTWINEWEKNVKRKILEATRRIKI